MDVMADGAGHPVEAVMGGVGDRVARGMSLQANADTIVASRFPRAAIRPKLGKLVIPADKLGSGIDMVVPHAGKTLIPV